MLQPFNRLFSTNNKLESNQLNNNEDDVIRIDVAHIIPNPFQPRTEFDQEKIEELAKTLHTHGIIQPIVVRKNDDNRYEIVAGERRWRAAKYLGWDSIPAIIKQMTDTETASIALIENIQREELSVIEEANAYAKLIEMHSLTQEALAQRLGKSQSTIANRMRLLTLPNQVQEAIMRKVITERHARALMRLKKEEEQIRFLNEIIDKQLNVRETDELIKKYLDGPKATEKKKSQAKFVSKDIRIVTNTIRRSIKMIESTGVNVDTSEEDFDDYYQITIKVKK